MITVVTPSIPPRLGERQRAARSVDEQTLPAAAHIIEIDHDREGAAVVRQRGLEQVTTPWVAFLDDDDEFRPFHLQRLMETAEETQADYVYSWYEVIGGGDPMPMFFGKPWDNEQPHQTTITTLVRTEIAQAVGFTPGDRLDPNGSGIVVGGEDYVFTLGCMEKGAKIVHLAEKTWFWYHHGENTSGMPSRW